VLKYFIWDFDGTLVDTYPSMTLAFQRALKAEGINAGKEEIMSLLKKSSKDALAYYNLNSTFKRQWKVEEERVDKEMSQPFHGVLEVLDLIKNKDGLNFIVTHRNKTTYDYLEYYKILNYFTDIITIEEANHRKPNTDLFDQIISRNNIEPAQCLSIGDRDLDMMPSKALGLKTCLYNPKKIENKIVVDYEITHYNELQAIITKNFQKY